MVVVALQLVPGLAQHLNLSQLLGQGYSSTALPARPTTVSLELVILAVPEVSDTRAEIELELDFRWRWKVKCRATKLLKYLNERFQPNITILCDFIMPGPPAGCPANPATCPPNQPFQFVAA